MIFRQLLDLETRTYTYLIADQGQAALVDSVLEHVERDLRLLRELGLTLRYCIETHVHADHITGAARLREQTGCLGLVPAGSQVECADQFLEDGATIQVGDLAMTAIATPGHTDSHLAYQVGTDRVLTGDALFIRGCGRTDFQNGDAGLLYDAVTQRLFTLPEDTLIYPGHDYKGQTVSTIKEEKQFNPRFAGHSRSDFITLMQNLNLPNPKKLMEALPANQACGKVVSHI